jgi:hypothetical protein
MNFIIVISGPISLETIFCSQRCTTDDLLPEFFPTPKNDAGKRKGEARESEASSRESGGQERTHT